MMDGNPWVQCSTDCFIIMYISVNNHLVVTSDFLDDIPDRAGRLYAQFLPGERPLDALLTL
jgi:hypothetical protein